MRPSIEGPRSSGACSSAIASQPPKRSCRTLISSSVAPSSAATANRMRSLALRCRSCPPLVAVSRSTPDRRLAGHRRRPFRRVPHRAAQSLNLIVTIAGMANRLIRDLTSRTPRCTEMSRARSRRGPTSVELGCPDRDRDQAPLRKRQLRQTTGSRASAARPQSDSTMSGVTKLARCSGTPLISTC